MVAEYCTNHDKTLLSSGCDCFVQKRDIAFTRASVAVPSVPIVLGCYVAAAEATFGQLLALFGLP